MNNSNVNTTSPMDLTEPGFPGKGVGYDWRSVVVEAAASDHLSLIQISEPPDPSLSRIAS